MKPSEDIKPITYLKTRAADLIESINTRRSPVIITQNGEARAVVQDIQSYERDHQTLLILKLLAQGITAAEKNELIEQDLLFKGIDKKLCTEFTGHPSRKKI